LKGRSFLVPRRDSFSTFFSFARAKEKKQKKGRT